MPLCPMQDALLDPLERSEAGIRTDGPALVILQLWLDTRRSTVRLHSATAG